MKVRLRDEFDYLDSTDRLIGRVSRRWNTLSHMTFVLFHGLSGMPKAKAEAVFSCFRADSSERDVTGKMAAVTLANHKDLHDQVLSILRRIQNASSARNDAIHHALVTDQVGWLYVVSPNARRAADLNDNYTILMENAAEVAAALAHEFAEIINAVSERLCWPEALP